MAKTTALIIITLTLLTGCETFRGRSSPVLRDSDIPHMMAPGVYRDIHGESYAVTKDAPRFSVSEGYIFDSVARPRLKWYQRIKIETLYIGILSVILVYAIRRK